MTVDTSLRSVFITQRNHAELPTMPTELLFHLDTFFFFGVHYLSRTIGTSQLPSLTDTVLGIPEIKLKVILTNRLGIVRFVLFMQHPQVIPIKCFTRKRNHLTVMKSCSSRTNNIRPQRQQGQKTVQYKQQSFVYSRGKQHAAYSYQSEQASEREWMCWVSLQQEQELHRCAQVGSSVWEDDVGCWPEVTSA